MYKTYSVLKCYETKTAWAFIAMKTKASVSQGKSWKYSSVTLIDYYTFVLAATLFQPRQIADRNWNCQRSRTDILSLISSQTLISLEKLTDSSVILSNDS